MMARCNLEYAGQAHSELESSSGTLLFGVCQHTLEFVEQHTFASDPSDFDETWCSCKTCSENLIKCIMTVCMFSRTLSTHLFCDELRPGSVLKAGAILISGDGTDEDEEAEDEDRSGEEEEGESKMGSDEIRVYYNRAIKASQARGAKVLGHITTNLKLMGGAKPGGLYHLSGWGERYDEGMGVDLADVQFV